MKDKKITVPEIKARKNGQNKISMITAYDYTMAQLLNESGVDILLVGDTLGMLSQGRKNTLGVSLEQMIYHCHCVAKGASRAHVVGDMPFMTYQSSREEAVHNAGMLLKKGQAESVKLEGGIEMAETIRYMVEIGIPVMGHIGLKPQHVHHMGGFKLQGRNETDAKKIIKDAKALQDAGVYAIVLEGIPGKLAQKITGNLKIPSIGIGSGPHCDGQVLVCYDMFGMNLNFTPKFVKQFASVGKNIIEASQEFIKEIQDGSYPGPEHFSAE